MDNPHGDSLTTLSTSSDASTQTEELNRYASLLAATLEAATDGIVAVDLAGNIVTYNTKFIDIWRFPEDMLRRRQSQEMMAHAAQQMEDPAAFLEFLKKRHSEPDVAAFDVLKMKDGRTFERYGFPQCIENKCVGLVVNFREVTDRVKAEAALRLSEEKYRLLWATASDAFLLFDEENTILEANAALYPLLGYQPGEVIGQNIAMLQPERLREGHQRGISRYLQTGIRTLNWRAAPAMGLHRDGREIPVEIAFNHISIEGKNLFAGFIRDVSERREAEKSMAVLAAIVDSSNDAIVSKTLEGIVTSWNASAEKLFGYTAQEMIGKSILTIIPPERHAEEPVILAKQARGERIEHFETVRVRKDGQHIHVSITISPIRDSQGNIIGISKIVRDITERKQAENEREELLQREQAARKEAETANRIKDEFLATLSHELRTPLTAILGWSGMIMEKRLSQEDLSQGLEIIHRSARLQSQLVEDILDVSRIVTGKLRIEVQPVNLASVIESAIESVSPSANAKNIRLQRVLDSEAGLVSGDPSRLQQVVWNLLSNAIKFTPKGGRVQVRLERVASHAQIVVTDNGSGISPEILPHIFERFRQGDQTSTRYHGGLGLGLAIVRHIVEIHGGTVFADSAGEGHGASFTVKLPVMATRPLETRTEQEVESASPHVQSDYSKFQFGCPSELQGLHVLVVDDDEDARRLVKTVLESCDARVTTASSAEEGLAALQEGRPHVLISDLGMPGENGYSLIRKIRALAPEQGGQTPAAALTAYARVEDRLQVLRSGFQIHLAKPIEPAELVAVVANLAQRITPPS